jgi:hypothetical protein
LKLFLLSDAFACLGEWKLYRASFVSSSSLILYLSKYKVLFFSPS